MRDASELHVNIHFKDLSTDEELLEHLKTRIETLAQEFREIERIELTLEPNAGHIKAHAHVSGKQTDVAAHVEGLDTTRLAGDRLLDKLERELRTHHDKRIYSQRRRAQKDRIDRTG